MCEVVIKTEFGNEDTLDPLEKNILRQRFEFYQRCQKSEETLFAFLEEIQGLAESCEFYREEKEFLIRDRFLCGLNDKSLQLALLATGGNPSLPAVFAFCRERLKETNEDIKLEELNKGIYLDVNVDIVPEDNESHMVSLDNPANDSRINKAEEDSHSEDSEDEDDDEGKRFQELFSDLAVL